VDQQGGAPVRRLKSRVPGSGLNWRGWALVTLITEGILLVLASQLTRSTYTYILAVIFPPIMVLTGYWSKRYHQLVQRNAILTQQAEQNLSELTRFFEAATAASNITQLGEDLNTIAEKLAVLMQVQMCGFFLHEPGLDSLIATAAPHGMQETRLFNQMRLNQLRFPANPSNALGRVYVNQQPLIIPNCLTEPSVAGLMPETYGFRQLLLVPLGAGGRPRGVLMLANKLHGSFADYDVQLATSLGAEVAISLENSFLYEKVRDQAIKLDASIEMLNQVSKALTATTVGVRPLLQAVASAVRQLSGCSHCLITMGESAPGDQVIEASEGFETSLVGRRVSTITSSLVNQVVAEQQSVWSEDLPTDPRFVDEIWAMRHNLHSGLGIPMFLERRFVGTITLYYHDRRPFDPILIQVLQILGNQTAVAVDNARRYQREREASDILRRANLRLQEADRMKSEFLTNMSHELRTPLNAIIGFSEVLEDPANQDLGMAERHEFTQNIHRSGRRLLGLVNDLLDLSTIQAGKMEFHPQECVVAEAVESAVAAHRLTATEKRLEVRVLLHEPSPRVVFDMISLKHVLYNLVSNAVKFTPIGGTIIIRAQERPEGTVISVSDNGIGIHPQHQGEIFEEFKQLDGSTSRGYEGTGVGLALSKRLLEMQGAVITVDSEPGRGSTFSITIPRSAKQLAPAAELAS
jgi:signal transduction histidine kinase